MILSILCWPDPILSAVADPVGTIDDDIRELARNMLDTMYAAPGRGLAAPQVGVLRRLFVMDTTWKDGPRAPRILIDPEILTTSDDNQTNDEGCLSIPGILAPVARPSTITMRWRDETGQTVEETLTGFDAVCAQHEYDHLDGLVTFDRVSADLRAKLEAEYAP